MENQEFLQKLVANEDLQFVEMETLMTRLMAGELSPAMASAMLVALRMKGETIEEISAAASVMRSLVAKVNVTGDRSHLIDVVGTGGDGAQSFNISTTSIFVAAAAGARIAKHGNRSVSSKCGSADVLEALGVNLALTADQVAQCVDQCGVGFMFAPNHHSAMKNVVPIRRELAVRTMFNILGPLTNPADAPNHLMGVYSPGLVLLQAEVMKRLGANHVLVVHAEDGMDEASISSATMVAELRDGNITQYRINPEDFGLQRQARESLQVNDVAESKSVLLDVLANKAGAPRDIVVLNSGMAIYAAGLAENIATGVAQAGQLLADGSAMRKLEAFVVCTRQFATSA